MKGIYPVTLADIGGTFTLNVNHPYSAVHIISAAAVTLGANFVITTSGSPIEGREYTLFITLGGDVNLNGNAFTLFGRNVDADMLKSTAGGMIVVEAKYLSGAWKICIIPNFLASAFIEAAQIKDGTISTAKLADNLLTYAKLQDFTDRGYALRGGAAGAPEEFNAKTSGNMLMGNGTDLVSQAMSGDVTMDGSGVTTIGANKITEAMLAFTISTDLEASITISSAQILTLNASPITIVAAPGSGKYIEVISASTDVNFVSAAYAANTTLQLINESATIAQLQDTAALISTVDKVTKFKDVTSATAAQTQIIKNSGLQVKVATGDPTTGDGTITVNVLYRIIG